MSNTTTCSSTNTNQIPLTEVLQILHQDVLNFQNILNADDSEKAVQQVLDELADYQIDERVPKNVSTFITEMLENKHEYSHETLSSDVTFLVKTLEEAVASQVHKDNVASIRTILKVMVKHADQITRWLEEEGY